MRQVVSEFPINKRCLKCDTLLSASMWDTKPLAVRVLSSKAKGLNQQKFECIQCATKGFLKQVTLDEIDIFLKFMKIRDSKGVYEVRHGKRRYLK